MVEHWATLDQLGLLTQSGVAPAQTELPYATRWPMHTNGQGSQAGDPQANLALVRRFFDEVCNGRRLEVADELFAAGHRYHDPSIPGVAAGPAGIQQDPGPVVPYQQGFSNAHWQVEDMLAEGDTVITRWHGTGAPDGDLLGIPAAGGKVFVRGTGCNESLMAKSWRAGRSGIRWECCSSLGSSRPRGCASVRFRSFLLLACFASEEKDN